MTLFVYAVTVCHAVYALVIDNKSLVDSKKLYSNVVDSSWLILLLNSWCERGVEVIIIIIIFSSLALEVTHKKARPVQSVLT